MTLKELFKKHNAQPGFKFKNKEGVYAYEVLYIGKESVFVKSLVDGEESSFGLGLDGYIKYNPPKKTKKIMVADYLFQNDKMVTFVENESLGTNYRKVVGSDREILVEDD